MEIRSNRITLNIAGMSVLLDSRCTPLNITMGECYAKFILPGCENQVNKNITATGNPPFSLTLKVDSSNELFRETGGGERVLYQAGNWELWLDKKDCYVFVDPQASPLLRIMVDRQFSCGEVIVEKFTRTEQGFNPLENLGIRIFINWLANYGDIVVHASGIAYNGKGYCFAAPSGEGKSTLAANLSMHPGVEVLGEDSVIIRYLDDRFWIYGTPWHTDPAMCSATGVPLEKLFFIDRSIKLGIFPLQPIDGIARVMQNAFIPYYRPESVSSILERLAMMSCNIPFFSLNYPLGSEVLKLILSA